MVVVNFAFNLGAFTCGAMPSLAPKNERKLDLQEYREKLIFFSPLAFGNDTERQVSDSLRNELQSAGENHAMLFKMIRNDSKLVRTVFFTMGFQQATAHSLNFNVLWTGTHLKPFCLRTLHPWQRINHFPRSFELTRKDRLYRNIERMGTQYPHADFDFIPEFYVTPEDMKTFSSVCNTKYTSKHPFIVKPVASSRGRGIFIATHPSEIPLASSMLVSRYITNPYLVNGHKFDIRLYVLVTSFNPLVAYLYQDGLARFASEKYTSHARTFGEAYVHLTNYSLNRHSKAYKRNSHATSENLGHKWSLGALLRECKKKGINTQLLMLRIEDLVVKTLLSVQSRIAAACMTFLPYDTNCFELFGFDILLDDAMKPWLLEVNLSPSLSCDSPLDFKVKASLLCDALNIACVPVRNPVATPASPLSDQSNVHIRVGIKTNNKYPRKFAKAEMLKKQAMHSKPSSTLAKLSRNVKNEERGKGHLNRALLEEKRVGGFMRIFPTKDSWIAYGDLVEDMGFNFDSALHVNLFGETELGHDDLSTIRSQLRDDVSNFTEIKQISCMSNSSLSALKDSIDRCAIYETRKSFASLKKVALPRLIQDKLLLNKGERHKMRMQNNDLTEFVAESLKDLKELEVPIEIIRNNIED